MEISAITYTIKDFIQTEEDVKSSLKKLSDIGYKNIQLSAVKNVDPYFWRKAADDMGIKIHAAHVNFTDLVNDIDKIKHDYEIMGCHHIGVGGLPREWMNEEGFKRFAVEYDNIAKNLKKSGFGTTYHNHHHDFERFGDKLGIEILAENSSTFTFCLDTYWIQAAGGDVVDWINKLSDRIEIIHFKDMGFARPDGTVMMEVGSGNLNWGKIIPLCKEIGVSHAIVEQDKCYDKDPFDCLKKSYDFLVGAGL